VASVGSGVDEGASVGAGSTVLPSTGLGTVASGGVGVSVGTAVTVGDMGVMLGVDGSVGGAVRAGSLRATEHAAIDVISSNSEHGNSAKFLALIAVSPAWAASTR
jgi:hypothetical protein